MLLQFIIASRSSASKTECIFPGQFGPSFLAAEGPVFSASINESFILTTAIFFSGSLCISECTIVHKDTFPWCKWLVNERFTCLQEKRGIIITWYNYRHNRLERFSHFLLINLSKRASLYHLGFFQANNLRRLNNFSGKIPLTELLLFLLPERALFFKSELKPSNANTDTTNYNVVYSHCVWLSFEKKKIVIGDHFQIHHKRHNG